MGTEDKPTEDREKMTIYKPGREALAETNPDGTLNFYPLQLWENKLL